MTALGPAPTVAPFPKAVLNPKLIDRFPKIQSVEPVPADGQRQSLLTSHLQYLAEFLY